MANNDKNKKLYGRDIIGNRNKSAIALEYQRNEEAPKVIATGKG